MPWGGRQRCLPQGEPTDSRRMGLDRLSAISDFETRAEAECMWGLCPAGRVLDIGTYLGFSAILWALAGAQHVDTIDPHLGVEGISERPMPQSDTLTTCLINLEHYGVRDRVTLHIAQAAAVLPDLCPNLFHLAFIDGDHEWALEDTVNARRLLAPGGLLVWHDVGRWSAIDRAVGWARHEGGDLVAAVDSVRAMRMP